MEDVPGVQGHHVFIDRYYTNLVLVEELYNMGCHITGTIQANRKELPIILNKLIEPKRLQMQWVK